MIRKLKHPRKNRKKMPRSTKKQMRSLIFTSRLELARAVKSRRRPRRSKVQRRASTRNRDRRVTKIHKRRKKSRKTRRRRGRSPLRRGISIRRLPRGTRKKVPVGPPLFRDRALSGIVNQLRRTPRKTKSRLKPAKSRRKIRK